MALIPRSDHFRKLAARAKLLKRHGIVLKRRDLEDFLALLAGVEEAISKGSTFSHLAHLMEPFKELTESDK